MEYQKCHLSSVSLAAGKISLLWERCLFLCAVQGRSQGARWRVMESAGFRTPCILKHPVDERGLKAPMHDVTSYIQFLICICNELYFHGLSGCCFFCLTGERRGISVETGQQSFAPRTLPQNPKIKVQVVNKQCSQHCSDF
jgi:hypothetical protein